MDQILKDKLNVYTIDPVVTIINLFTLEDPTFVTILASLKIVVYPNYVVLNNCQRTSNAQIPHGCGIIKILSGLLIM